MHSRFPYVISFAALALIACGSDPFDDGNDLGTGTRTLVVQASVRAESAVPNGDIANDFTTTFEVDVFRAGGPVADAIVHIDSAAGPVQLHWSGDAGEYRGSQVGYHEVYRLDVDAGADYVHDVKLDGPDIHVFTGPDAAVQVNSQVPNDVIWERDEQAEVAGIRTLETDLLTIPDTGIFTIGAGTMRSSSDQSEHERVTVWRTNQLAPDGGAGDSSFRVRIENYLDLVVAPRGF